MTKRPVNRTKQILPLWPDRRRNACGVFSKRLGSPLLAATAKDNAAAKGFPETRRAAARCTFTLAFAAAHHSTACRRANASSGRDASAPAANPCTYSSHTHADRHFRFRSSPGAALSFVARFGRSISIGKRPCFIAYSSDDPLGPGVAYVARWFAAGSDPEGNLRAAAESTRVELMGHCWMRCGVQRRKLQHSANSVVSCSCNAGVAELADALDSKSRYSQSVWVRTPPPVCSARVPHVSREAGSRRTRL